jgi:hypothetical protein
LSSIAKLVAYLSVSTIVRQPPRHGYRALGAVPPRGPGSTVGN